MKGLYKNIRKLTEDIMEYQDEQLSMKSKQKIMYNKLALNYRSADKSLKRTNSKENLKLKEQNEELFKIILQEVSPSRLNKYNLIQNKNLKT